MKRLVLDASYLVAHFNEDDAHHESALEIQDDFMAGRWQDLILLDCAFAETMTILQRKKGYDVAKQVGDVLRNGEEITWLHLGDRLDAVWNRFLTQPKGRMSIVDCALVSVCEEFGIDKIATFDRGFDDVPGITRVPADRGLTASPSGSASSRAAQRSRRSSRTRAARPARGPPRRRS